MAWARRTVTIDNDVLRLVVNDYTREAGVRQLERELGTVLRKTATRIAAGKEPRPIAIDAPAVVGSARAAEGLSRWPRRARQCPALPRVSPSPA